MLVASPALLSRRHPLDSLAKGMLGIIGNLGIDRNWNVRYATGQELLADPAPAADRVRVKVGRMCDQPRRVSENALAIFDAERLLNRIVPEYRVVIEARKILAHGLVIPPDARSAGQTVERRVVVGVPMAPGCPGKRRPTLAERFFKVVHPTGQFAACSTLLIRSVGA